MPAPFAFPDRDAMAWLPRHVPAVKMADGGSAVSLFNALARLRPGVTAEQASAEATARAQAGPSLGMVGVAVFGTTSKAVIAATPLMDALTADVRPAILVLLAAVGLLLVAAVMNVASMQLAHAAARRREVALRAALGGGAGRIARQLFVENGVIAVTGGAAGLALAVALHQLLPRLLPADFPRLEDVTFGWPVAAFAVAASLAASLVFGALPTLLARRLNLVAALTEDSLAPVGARLRTRVARTRAAIMAAQVAVAAILLVGAALIGRSFVGLLHADRGFQPANLLTAQLPLPDRQYTGPQRAALVDALLDRLRRTPGVSDAAATSILPLIHTVSLMSFPMPSHDPKTAPGDGADRRQRREPGLLRRDGHARRRGPGLPGERYDHVRARDDGQSGVRADLSERARTRRHGAGRLQQTRRPLARCRRRRRRAPARCRRADASLRLRLVPAS